MEKEKSAKGKIQEICDILKQETIEPAKQEAGEIVENAHMQANEIVKEAEKKAEEILAGAKKAMEEEKRAFDASLNMACKQTLETLRQRIEKELFASSLSELLKTPSQDPQVIANLVNSIVTAIDKEGIDVDLSAYIPKEVSPKKVSELLSQQVVKRLRDKGVKTGDFEGGVQVKMHDRKITVDITEDALKDLVASFVRKEFRDMIFNA